MPGHELDVAVIDSNVFHQFAGGIAIATQGFYILRTTEAEHHSPILVEFIALGVTAKVIVIVQYQNARIGTHLLLVVACRCQPAHACADHDQIIVLIEGFIVCGFVAPPG